MLRYFKHRAEKMVIENELYTNIFIIGTYKDVRDKFYHNHYNRLFHTFWKDLNNVDEKFRYRLLQDTLNMRDNITNSILYKCDEVNNTDVSNESFPDNSCYWVYDDYSNINRSKILYGTYEVQKIIWKHQNPMSCRDKNIFT